MSQNLHENFNQNFTNIKGSFQQQFLSLFSFSVPSQCCLCIALHLRSQNAFYSFTLWNLIVTLSLSSLIELVALCAANVLSKNGHLVWVARCAVIGASAGYSTCILMQLLNIWLSLNPSQNSLHSWGGLRMGLLGRSTPLSNCCILMLWSVHCQPSDTSTELQIYRESICFDGLSYLELYVWDGVERVWDGVERLGHTRQ